MRTSTANGLLFLLILFTGIFLRAYNWQEVPFTHDEYSALIRAQVDSFKVLIEKGVMPDGHPAGVQVFLFYWISTVGTHPFFVKLPFLLFGIAGIYLTFKIGSYWFNDSVGLLTAAFIASLQYTIFYSQIARPYASGLFFILLALWYWSLLIWEEKALWRNWTGWVIGAILCCYNHYFSMLAVSLIGISGFFLVNKNRLRHYFISLFVIALAFIPHIKIFFHHLNQKGLSWLSEPDWYFLIRYIQYCFQFALWPLILFFGLGLLGIIYHLSKTGFSGKVLFSSKRILLFIWFLLPLVIGLGYSIWVQPVIQYSVLIFSFPFLVIGVLSFLPSFTPSFNTGLVIIILVSNIYVLIHNRQHYHIFYDKNRYKNTFKEAQKDSKHYGKDKLSYFLACNENISNYWFKKTSLTNRSFTLMDTIDLNQFNGMLAKNDKPFIAMAWPGKMKWDFFAVAHQHYPYLLKRKKFHSGSYCLFAKKPHPDTVDPYYYTYREDFEKTNFSEKFKQDKITGKKAFKGNHSYFMKAGEKYGPTIKARPDTILKTMNDIILGSARMLKVDSTPLPLLTVELLNKNGENLHWDAGKPFLSDENNQSWYRVVRSVPLAIHELDPASDLYRVGIWNKDETTCYVDKLELKVIKGNPYYYARHYPIEKPLN